MTSPRRIAPWSARAALLTVAIIASSCSSSGRALPPARPDQTQTIVTTTLPATTVAKSAGTDGTTADGNGADGVGSDSGSAAPSTRVTASEGQAGQTGRQLSVTLPWGDNDQIPEEFTCKGEAGGVSPAISWANLIPSDREVAIVMTDPDANDFAHWVIWGIPPSVSSLTQGVPAATYRQAINGFGKLGYGPPCPPSGSHTYVLTLYDLATPINLPAGSAASDVITQIEAQDANSVVVSAQVDA